MIWAPAATGSSGPRPLTVPRVPTGMNPGVSTTPCAVTSRPRRAAPSVARSSNLTRVVARPAGSYDEGSVAVGVETVVGGQGVAIGGEDEVAAGEGGDEDEEGGAGEVEVREDGVDDAEAVAGPDEDPRPALHRAHHAVVSGRALERADRRRPHGDDPTALCARGR